MPARAIPAIVKGQHVLSSLRKHHRRYVCDWQGSLAVAGESEGQWVAGGSCDDRDIAGTSHELRPCLPRGSRQAGPVCRHTPLHAGSVLCFHDIAASEENDSLLVYHRPLPAQAFMGDTEIIHTDQNQCANENSSPTQLQFSLFDPVLPLPENIEMANLGTK